MRILVLGLDNAGKSTVVARWVGHDVDSIAPTFGFEIHDILLGDALVTVWDIGGQECIRAFWRSYFEGGTDAVCFVVDAADTTRMGKAKAELQKVLLGEGEDRIGVFGGASVLVLVNKQDLAGASSLEQVRETMRLDEFSSSEHDIAVLGCSARQNVDSCAAALKCHTAATLVDLRKDARVNDQVLPRHAVGGALFDTFLAPIFAAFKHHDYHCLADLVESANQPQREFIGKCFTLSAPGPELAAFLSQHSDSIDGLERALKLRLVDEVAIAGIRSGLSSVSLGRAAQETKGIMKNMELEYIKLLEQRSRPHPSLHPAYHQLLQFRRGLAYDEGMGIRSSSSPRAWRRVFGGTTESSNGDDWDWVPRGTERSGPPFPLLAILAVVLFFGYTLYSGKQKREAKPATDPDRPVIVTRPLQAQIAHTTFSPYVHDSPPPPYAPHPAN